MIIDKWSPNKFIIGCTYERATIFVIHDDELSCHLATKASLIPRGKGKGEVRCPNDLVTTTGTCNKKGAHAMFCQRS